MQTSNYLRQTLFHQPSHATYQLFESKSEALFQRPGKKSFIEVHHQRLGKQRLPSAAPVLDSEQDSDRSSLRSSLLDQSGCSALNDDPPPTYDNLPGLLRQDILNLKDVEQIETVSALVAASNTWANTHVDKGNEAQFSHMVSEPSKPSQRLPF